MRVRIKGKPPTENSIKNILKGVENDKHLKLSERLARSGYLDKKNKPRSCEDRLKFHYSKDGAVLFLGAGVSCCSGIPNWNELIQDVLQKRGIECYCEVERAFPDVLTQFDWAGYLSRSKGEFCKTLYKVLYGKPEFQKLKKQLEAIPPTPVEQEGWEDWPSVLNELRKNKTLEAVGELLVKQEPRTAKTEFKRNPRIHAVITVNADNLLEMYCLAKTSGKTRLLTMVDRASVADHPYAIPVYHLHGTLDARRENFMRSDRPKGVKRNFLQDIDGDLLPELVFRESEYFDTIASPTNFVNYTPQSYFQRHNVIFIGTSLDDLNIRRWLYISYRERIEQRTKYLRELYWEKYQDAECEAKLASRRHFWLRTRDSLSGKMQKAVELVMQNMGVEVKWFDNFTELQHYLDELKQFARDEDFSRPPPLSGTR